jgi:RIO-like serine/threonine protein kinase
MNADLSYDEALSNIERILIKGKSLKAEVFTTRVRGRRFVVKNFSKKGFFERHLIGRLIVAREAHAYRALAGIDGLPAHFKRLNPFALAIEYLDGRDLGAIRPGEIGPEIIIQFEAVVKKLHERGWVHLDLQRRSNILVVEGNVFLVDLASAFNPGSVPLVGNCLAGLLGFADRLSLIKIKNIYAPELLTFQERKLLRLRNLFTRRKW